jgi:hypothetical protein
VGRKPEQREELWRCEPYHVELWKIEGAGHIPLWNERRWPTAALDFLLRHRRASPL